MCDYQLKDALETDRTMYLPMKTRTTRVLTRRTTLDLTREDFAMADNNRETFTQEQPPLRKAVGCGGKCLLFILTRQTTLYTSFARYSTNERQARCRPEKCCPPPPTTALFFPSAKRSSQERKREKRREREASCNKRNYKHVGRYIQETFASNEQGPLDDLCKLRRR